MTLKTHSPHLSYFLERTFTVIPEHIEDSFKFVMERGGSLELDYQRPEGQSFNPRPARIALIGIKDAGIKDQESVQLLILSSLLEKGQFVDSVSTKDIFSAFPNLDQSRINNIEELCHLTQISKESFSNPDISIYLCLFIDRMRHSHLSGQDKIKEMLDKIHLDLILDKEQDFNLKLIIKNWRNKMIRQFPEKI